MKGIYSTWEEMIKFLKHNIQKHTQVNLQNLLNSMYIYSVISRHIFLTLNQYWRPNTEPKFF